MSRSKKEEQLKKNERYPLRSLTTEQHQALLLKEKADERKKKGKK